MGNTGKPKSGAVAAPGSCQTCLVRWDQGRIAWRVGGCSRIWVIFPRKGEPLRAAAGAQPQARPAALPPPAALGFSLGFWASSAAVSFSVQGVRSARLRKEPRLKKGKICVAGGRCEAERPAESGARAALWAGGIGQPVLQPQQRLPWGVYGPARTWRQISALPRLSGPARDSSPSSRPENPCRTSEGHC